MNKCPTAHIGAKYGQIAKRVLLPGDPLRAQWIAKTYLKDVKLVNSVRNMFAYTGTYKNVPITVMGSGMGVPSLSLYTYELYNFYDVSVIYRVGSAGVSIKSGCNVGDVILETEAWSDVPIKPWLNVKLDGKNLLKCDKHSAKNILDVAKKKGIKVYSRRVASTNFFYNVSSVERTHKITGAYALEMEGFGLLLQARMAKKKGASLVTVSDCFESGEEMSSKERQTTFYSMVEIALDAIIKEKV